MPRRATRTTASVRRSVSYDHVLSDVVLMLDAARRSSVRALNALMTATYWEIGRRIIVFEQHGNQRAAYGDALLDRLSKDLARRFGRGFSVRNLRSFRAFYAGWAIRQTRSAESGSALAVAAAQSPNRNRQTASAESGLRVLAARFPLPWSHYVRLLSVKDASAREFYETEALRGGWSIRQLDRQIDSLFYERTMLSRNKVAMLQKGAKPKPEDRLTPEQEIKDPFVLEFLGLKDEYSEHEMEEALIQRLEAGQMHLYCNYAAEHWTNEGENPPVGLILCTQQDSAVAHYALENLPNRILAAEYRTKLPAERMLAAEVHKARQQLETQQLIRHPLKRTTTRRQAVKR